MIYGLIKFICLGERSFGKVAAKHKNLRSNAGVLRLYGFYSFFLLWRKFYQKITNIYATSLDCDPSATATKRFFVVVQNKMHYAIHGSTAAEVQAMRRIPMTMSDWEVRLSGFLRLWDREILRDAGKVTAELAKAHAESEFEKYRLVQDRLFESDFDRILKQLK